MNYKMKNAYRADSVYGVTIETLMCVILKDAMKIVIMLNLKENMLTENGYKNVCCWLI